MDCFIKQLATRDYIDGINTTCPICGIYLSNEYRSLAEHIRIYHIHRMVNDCIQANEFYREQSDITFRIQEGDVICQWARENRIEVEANILSYREYEIGEKP